MRELKLIVDPLLRTRFCPRTKPLLSLPLPSPHPRGPL